MSPGTQFRDRPHFNLEKGSVPQSRGIALVGVLWILALLTVSAAALSAALREDLRLTGNLIAAAQARRAAEGGVELVLARLIGGPQPGSSGSRLGVAGSPPSSFRLGEAHVEVAFVDEAGRLDLNEAPEALLENYFRVAGLGAAAAREVVSGILARRQAPLPFVAVDELAGVPGLPADVFRRSRSDFTVHAGQLGINAAAASRAVLLAVPGASAAEVDAYLAQREANRAEGLAPPRAPESLRHEYARVASAVYRIHAEARVPGGTAARLTAVVDLRRPSRHAPYTIREWRYE